MPRARFPGLDLAWQRSAPRRAVLALLGSLPAVIGAGRAPANAGSRERKRGVTAEHNRKGSKRRRFCLDGKNVSATHKKKKRRLRRNGATPGPCPTGCNCADGQICVYGVCQPCSVTCTGTPEACGADLATALLAGGNIYLCPGLYAGNFTVSVAGTAIFGAGGDEETASNTVIDGGQAGYVFFVEENIEGRFVQLRITGGEGSGGGGGGIVMRSGKGHAISDPLVVDACTFAGNNAGYGSAITTTGKVTVSNSLFTGNTATTDGGAGVFLDSADGSTLVSSISNCRFTGNSTTGNGGAVQVRNQRVDFAACAFTSNAASDGGAIYATGDATPFEVNLDNQTTIDGNSATGGGSSAGGIAAVGSATVNLNGATVQDNTPINCSGVTGC